MKKQSIVLALLCLLLLAGCGKKQETPAPAEPSGTQTEQPAAQPEPPAEPARAERPAVEDNGGQFVSVDGKVWFRRYDAGAIDEPQLWGEFLAVMPTHGVTSQLCYYDGASVTEAMADDGFGELWFGVDGFYLARPKGNGGAEAYFKPLDGAETVLREGTIAGVSENGKYAAVRALDGTYYVYEGTKEVLGYGTEADYCAFCALTDDGSLLCCNYDYDRGEVSLDQVDLGSGYVISILGFLPAAEDAQYPAGWEVEQCLIDGGDVWCAFGVYEGTGHFLADTLCVRAKLGVQDSLAIIEDQPTTEYPFVPKLYKGADGSVRRVEHLPDEVEVSLDGDLVRYDDQGEASVLIEGFLPGTLSSAPMIVQASENIDGAAYLAVAQAYHDEESDIGWRMAYRPGEIRYLRVPLRSGTEAEPLDGEEWHYEAQPSADAVLADFLGTWSLYATEVEGDRSDTLPEGTWETIEFFEDGRATIEGSDYQNEFSDAETVPAGTGWGLLLHATQGEDMLYAFFEDGTLVGTVMMHFEVDGGTDAISRAGFYQRSFG